MWLGQKYRILPAKVFCARSAARLLSAGLGGADDLDSLARTFLGIPLERPADQNDWGSLFLGDEAIEAVREEAAILAALRRALEKECAKAGLAEVACLEMSLVPVVRDLELAGMPLKTEPIRAEETASASAMAAAEQRVRDCLGRPSLNVSSPKQLLQALCSSGLDIADTNEQSLLAAGNHPAIPAILEFRGHQKIAQLAAGLREAVRADGRIHARFDPLGADTGRFSCDSPNLQNIPRGPLRSAFVAPDGFVLAKADYSQIELRAVAALAGDPEMLGAFRRGDDLHRTTAAAILGKEESSVTPADRQLAKSVNFGLIYGQGAEGLVRSARQRFGVSFSVEEAMKFRDRFFAHYAGIARWHRKAFLAARDGAGESLTAMGRRRLIPPGANRWNRFTSLVNSPVQGGSADGMKAAMVALSASLPRGARMVSTIHDELVVECPREIAPAVLEAMETTMRSEMEKLYPDVPISVESSAGSCWG